MHSLYSYKGGKNHGTSNAVARLSLRDPERRHLRLYAAGREFSLRAGRDADVAGVSAQSSLAPGPRAAVPKAGRAAHQPRRAARDQPDRLFRLLYHADPAVQLVLLSCLRHGDGIPLRLSRHRGARRPGAARTGAEKSAFLRDPVLPRHSASHRPKRCSRSARCRAGADVRRDLRRLHSAFSAFSATARSWAFV